MEGPGAAPASKRMRGGGVGTRRGGSAAVKLLGEAMEACGVGCYLVPSGDAHASEYVSGRDKRRAHVSGFTGSAGLAVVFADAEAAGRAVAAATDLAAAEPGVHAGGSAFLWTDGRYFTQAEAELAREDGWRLMRMFQKGVPEPEAFVAGAGVRAEEGETGGEGRRLVVGYDPALLTAEEEARWKAAMEGRAVEMRAVDVNLVDAVWADRPGADAGVRLVAQEERWAGAGAAEKLDQVVGAVRKAGAQYMVVTAPDEVMWMFNVRGRPSDVPYCPVVHSYAVVDAIAGRAVLYVDAAKLGPGVTSVGDIPVVGEGWRGTGMGIVGGGADALFRAIAQLGAEESVAPAAGGVRRNGVVLLDKKTCNARVASAVRAGLLRPDLRRSPVAALKAVKNASEAQGFRDCHVRDGAALCRFLSALEARMSKEPFVERAAWEYPGGGGSVPLDEVGASDVLERIRREDPMCVGLSFPTIFGVGANGAIIHYTAAREGTPEAAVAHANNNACLVPGEMMLIDSGAQYVDGTTDVTRTVMYPEPSESDWRGPAGDAKLAHKVRCFTRVLQGHIALDTAVFPAGTTGFQLDILARTPLWRDGLDYRHGTGHGVGSFLLVHEGPHHVSFRPASNEVAVDAGMTCTNEPGYYEEGNFGCRIENVMLVEEAATPHNFMDRGYLRFANITWCPIQRSLIDKELLSPAEVAWVDAYHARCLEVLLPALAGHERACAWLKRHTRPL